MIQLRARIFILVLFFSLVSPILAFAEPPALSERINILKELVDAIGAAGDAITKITDGVKHLIVTGVEE